MYLYYLIKDKMYYLIKDIYRFLDYVSRQRKSQKITFELQEFDISRFSKQQIHEQ